MAAKVKPFWKRKTLAQFNQNEWESLCDGCGLYCLQKLENEGDDSVHYTHIACKLLGLQSCHYTNYAECIRFVPGYAQLTPVQADEFQWLPPTYGYRLVAEGKGLPPRHHLVCGDPERIHGGRISQPGRMLGETQVTEDDWEDHLILRTG